MKRRTFIRQSTLATGMLLVPSFLKAFEGFGQQDQKLILGNNEKILVVIQFSGGNDGLNTIIPYQNQLYYQHRPTLAIAKEKVLKVNDELGFHPELSALRNLHDQGELCIINSVGYPNPDRSHFRSMDIWHTASSSHEYLQTGWLGRYLDSNCDGCEKSYQAIETDDSLSLALKGINRKGMAIKNIQQLHKLTQEPFFKLTAQTANQNIHDGNGGLGNGYVDGDGKNDTLDYLYKTMAETASSADYIFEKNKTVSPTGDYPNSDLGKQLKQIATWIRSGLSTKVYYVSLNGFDTHVNQEGKHGQLLKTYGEAVEAFAKDLKHQGFWNNTLVMTFSEFGRRVEQNASNGTDHGTANSVILASGALKHKGFYNGAPDLSQLFDGDLRYQVDFREIYATVLNKWLGADDQAILMRKFNQLDFLG